MKKILVLTVLILALSASMAMAAPLASWTTYLLSPYDNLGTGATFKYYAVTLDATVDWNVIQSKYEYTYVLTNDSGAAPAPYNNDYYKAINRFTINVPSDVSGSIILAGGVTSGWTPGVNASLVYWDSGNPIAPLSNDSRTFSYFSKYGPSQVTSAAAIDGMTFFGPTLAPTTVPEASTLVGFGSALVMAGPGMIGWLRRRRA